MKTGPMHPIRFAAALAAAVTVTAAAPPALLDGTVVPPMGGALTLTSNFGEPRASHFHAGLDISTGGAVGREVLAPVDGRIVRVRASGVGYGRSLYLKADDGRLFVFGHLDAFEEPVASYVADEQARTGDYEQDLWPAQDRFTVRAGRRIAWTGESGAGPPHLHVEVRIGDVAYNPLRAGFAIDDTAAPRLLAVTFEPLDGHARVQGSMDARRFAWSGRDTLEVRAWGRLRLIVEAGDPRANGRPGLAPWEVALEDGADRIACRMDSASWASEMADADYVYARGRTGRRRGEQAYVLWAGAGVRPATIATSLPADVEAGTIAVGEGPPHHVRVTVRDLAGYETAGVIRLVPLDPGDGPPASPDAPPAQDLGQARWTFEPLPGRRLRILAEGPATTAPSAWIYAAGWHPATRSPRGWVTIVTLDTTVTTRLAIYGWTRNPPPAGDPPGSLPADAAGPVYTLRPVAGAVDVARGGFRWSAAADALYEPDVVVELDVGASSGSRHLAPLGPVVDLLPEPLPLAHAIRVAFAVPVGREVRGAGIYRFDGRDWEYVGGDLDDGRVDRDARWITGMTRRLGRFALMRDTIPPVIGPPAGTGAAWKGAYARRAIEARVIEEGSGVDRRASGMTIDGRPVPTEWDPDARVLRWRPRVAPKPGAYEVELTARDVAGNEARRRARVVLD